MTTIVVARAPGRVNLIGDHTDYSGGLALPMAIDRDVSIRITSSPSAGEGGEFTLTSDREPGLARFAIGDASLDPASLAGMSPEWGRLAAAVFAAVGARRPGRAETRSSIPVASGLSSSAAFEVALALALGAEPEPLPLARLCRDAEHAATGTPCGILDQLTSLAGVKGRALLIDFQSESWEEVPVPEQAEIFVVDSGQRRRLNSSPYGQRRRELELAMAEIGPLRSARLSDLRGISDPIVRRRARHVITENARVVAAAEALRRGDLAELGALLNEGQTSYASDFGASTVPIDRLVERVNSQQGVRGARLTGGGFGGCVVAVADSGAFARCQEAGMFPGPAWIVTPSRGAFVDVVADEAS